MARKETYLIPKLDVSSINQVLQRIQKRLDEFDAEIPEEVPSSTIAVWSGDLADIPDGWLECNGENSTPDLTGVLIAGTTAYIMKS